jgi:hypothetical protein
MQEGSPGPRNGLQVVIGVIENSQPVPFERRTPLFVRQKAHAHPSGVGSEASDQPGDRLYGGELIDKPPRCTVNEETIVEVLVDGDPPPVSQDRQSSTQGKAHALSCACVRGLNDEMMQYPIEEDEVVLCVNNLVQVLDATEY